MSKPQISIEVEAYLDKTVHTYERGYHYKIVMRNNTRSMACTSDQVYKTPGAATEAASRFLNAIAEASQ